MIWILHNQVQSDFSLPPPSSKPFNLPLGKYFLLGPNGSDILHKPTTLPYPIKEQYLKLTTFSTTDQILSAANLIATDLVSLYATPSNPSSSNPYSGYSIISGIPGLLPNPPYYWWEAGAMFGTLIEYWYYTGDARFNEMVREGIVWQIGEGWDLVCL